MIVGEGIHKYDTRVYDFPGPVIDLGCSRWDWSQKFLDNGRHVIGFDPLETACPPGAVLYTALLMPFDGTVELQLGPGPDWASAVRGDYRRTTVTTVRAMSWSTFEKTLDEYPAILKMNIEGSEYGLISCWEHPPADQLVIAFHCGDRAKGYPPPQLSEFLLRYLRRWYEWTCIDTTYRWWLGLRKG